MDSLRKQDRKPQYTCIAFDLDGTLLDTLEDLTDSVNFVLHKFGYPKHTIEVVRSFIGNGIQKLLERAVPESVEGTEFEEISKLFKEYYKEHCQDKTKLYSGVEQMLSNLCKEGYQLAIVSNKADFAVKELYNKYFAKYMRHAVGEKEGIKRKPAPDMLLHVLKEMNVDKREVLYVGDSEVDKQTADNTGVDCLMVSWGFRDKEELEKLAPIGIIDKAEEIWKYI